MATITPIHTMPDHNEVTEQKQSTMGTQETNQKTVFELTIEAEMKESVESIREMPIDERRRRIEKEKGQRTKFVSRFSLIGRGNVLRDRILSRDDIEASLDEALRPC